MRGTARARARSAAVGLAVAAIASIGVFGTASAESDDPPAEAYPPTPSLAPDRPEPPGEIPKVGGDGGEIAKTGNDGTDAWLKLGAGAVLAGGILVTATTRRRQEVKA